MLTRSHLKQASKERVSPTVIKLTVIMFGRLHFWRDKQMENSVYRHHQLVPVGQTLSQSQQTHTVRSRLHGFADSTQQRLARWLTVYLLGSKWQTSGGRGVCVADIAASSTEWWRHTETGSSSFDPPANLAVRRVRQVSLFTTSTKGWIRSNRKSVFLVNDHLLGEKNFSPSTVNQWTAFFTGQVL